jgi:hypothetical protein
LIAPQHLRTANTLRVTPEKCDYRGQVTTGELIMKWLWITLFLIGAQTTAAEAPSLVGVWQIQSTVYDGEEQIIRQPPQVKIFTRQHFFYTYYDPSLSSAEPILSAGHGSYVFNAGRLSETIENHSNTALVGQTFSVIVVLSDDGNAFQQEVDLGKYILRERWVRIE